MKEKETALRNEIELSAVASAMADVRLAAQEFALTAQKPLLIYGLSAYTDLTNMHKEAIRAELIAGRGEDSQAENSTNKNMMRELQKCANAPVVLENYAKLVEPKENLFTAMNYAFSGTSWVYTVPAGKKVSESILLSNHGAQYGMVIVEDGADATIVIRREDCAGTYSSFVLEAVVGKRASLNLVSVQNLPGHVTCFEKKHAKISAGGVMRFTDCTLGGELVISETYSTLEGRDARTKHECLFFSDGRQQLDMASSAIHEAQNTSSNIVVRGAASQKSKSLYRGLIRIGQGAAGSNGYQKSDILLLSRDARVNAIPNLEIMNNDVKCSHGASIGRCDPGTLFYMMSRGISRKEALGLLLRGFFAPLMSEMGDETVKASIDDAIDRKLKESDFQPDAKVN